MCWGSDGDGRLGNGGEDNTISKPTDYVINPDGETFKSIHAGHENTCGITDSGKLYCWGNNNNGKNGIGTTNTEKSPSTITFEQDTIIEKISIGLYHSCAIDSDNAVWCWGRAWNGNLGSGDDATDQYSRLKWNFPEQMTLRQKSLLVRDSHVPCLEMEQFHAGDMMVVPTRRLSRNNSGPKYPSKLRLASIRKNRSRCRCWSNTTHALS